MWVCVYICQRIYHYRHISLWQMKRFSNGFHKKNVYHRTLAVDQHTEVNRRIYETNYFAFWSTNHMELSFFWLGNILICDTFCTIHSIQHFRNSFDSIVRWNDFGMWTIYLVIFREWCHINRVKVVIFGIHKQWENEQFTSFYFIHRYRAAENSNSLI